MAQISEADVQASLDALEKARTARDNAPNSNAKAEAFQTASEEAAALRRDYTQQEIDAGRMTGFVGGDATSGGNQ